MTSGLRHSTAGKSGLALLLERFPEETEDLNRIFWKNSSFRFLCEDYRDCLAAWEYWRQATSEDAPALCQSYAELLQELEQEVRHYLKQEKSSPISFGEAGGDKEFKNPG